MAAQGIGFACAHGTRCGPGSSARAKGTVECPRSGHASPSVAGVRRSLPLAPLVRPPRERSLNMRSSNAALPFVLAFGLAAAAPAAADAGARPVAHASGGDIVELIYPS